MQMETPYTSPLLFCNKRLWALYFPGLSSFVLCGFGQITIVVQSNGRFGMRFSRMELTIRHFVVAAFMLFTILPVMLYAHSHYRTLRLPMQLLQPQDFFLPFGISSSFW
jgi:ABC-type maltose transport system permease subunit